MRLSASRVGVVLVMTMGVLLAVVPITGPSAAGAAAGTATPPAVEPGFGEVTAPAPGSTSRLVVPVTLSAPSARRVSVHWSTVFVSGAPSTPEPQAPTPDYTAASGVVRFPAGVTSRTVRVSVVGDAAAQFEYVVIEFSDPVGASLGGFYGLGFGQIDPLGVNPAPNVSFTTNDEFPYSGGPTPVTLSHPTSKTVTVDFAVTGGPSAVLYWGQWTGDGAVFSPGSGVVTFASGESSGGVTFTVSPEQVPGCQQTGQPPCYPSATVTLSTPSNATLGANPVVNVFFVPPA